MTRDKDDEPQAPVPRRADWNPRAAGAQCGDCPLRFAEGPVRGTHRAYGVVGLILGESPGRKEAERGFPFAGPSGVELEEALKFAGSNRKEWEIDNTLSCRPPLDRLEAVERKVNAENRKRKAINRRRRKLDRRAELLPTVPHPQECCAPRLDRVLARHLAILTLGTTALHAAAPYLKDKHLGIMAVRGTPLTVTRPDGREVKVMGTLHPAFVLREPRWRRTFKRDVRRAKRFFAGKSNWQEPVITYQPTPAELEAFLWDDRVDIHAVDIETDGIRPMEANLRCIGFAAPGVPGVAKGMPRAMVVPFLSIDGTTEYYSARDRERLKALIIRWHGDKTRAKVGHNYRYYDALVLHSRWGEFPIRNCFDSLCGHSVADSELPHALGFVGVDYDTDVPAWKAAHTAVQARSDHELWKYCALDCVVNVRIADPLARDIEARGQRRALQALQDNQDAAREMHVNGMLIDLRAAAAHRKRLQEEVIDYGSRFLALLRENNLEEAVAEGRRLALETPQGPTRRVAALDASDPDDDPLADAFAADLEELVSDEELAAIGGKKGLELATFNPTSAIQVRHLFFTHLGVPISPQLDKKEALTPAGERSTNDAVLRSIVCDRSLPEWIRTLADVLRRYRGALKPLGFPLGRLFHDPEDRDKGALYADGRLHADWKVQVAVTSRMATSPNCFDGATEVLTPAGWVRFDQYVEGTPVAQYAEDGRITFAKPTAYIRQHYKGDLRHIQTRAIDLCVTPDHRCLLRTRAGKHKVVFAADYVDDHQQLHAGQYRGGVGLGWLDAAIQFAVAVQADGRLLHPSGARGPAARVEFRFDKHRKAERLTQILTALGARYTHEETHHGGRTRQLFRVWAVDPGTTQALEALGAEKTLGAWVLQLSAAQLHVFCEELWHWDGCFTRRNHYSSSVRANVDWAQAALVLDGTRARIRPYMPPSGRVNWQIDVVHGSDSSWTTNHAATPVPHDGPVYCVSVPTSYIVTRRNDCVSITGQCQNWPIYLRDIVVAQLGCLLIGADYDQIELRLAAARWGFKRYLEALALGQDPHQITMELCFGPVMWTWEGAPPKRFFKKGIGKDSYFARMRDLAKRLFYASLYGADSSTIHRVLTSAEAEDGSLLFPELTIKQVALLHSNLLANLPELPAGWAAEEAFFEANGYVEEPVTGRRRYVATGKKNEVVNFAIQASAAGLINLALKRIRKRLAELRRMDEEAGRVLGALGIKRPIDYMPGDIGPGLINQMHDALYFEVRADLAEYVAQIVTEEMTCTHPAFPGVVFAAEGHAAVLDATGHSRMINA